MKARPILFSTSMVQALLEGKKTQTRRVVKDKKLGNRGVNSKNFSQISCESMRRQGGSAKQYCPYGKVGDLLWVRETFIVGVPRDENDMPVMKNDDYVWKTWYRASNPELLWDNQGEKEHDNPPWKPSIHMPKSLSRLTLEITNVRIERLHDISENDADAEGVDAANIKLQEHELDSCNKYKFLKLWDQINGEQSTNSNP